MSQFGPAWRDFDPRKLPPRDSNAMCSGFTCGFRNVPHKISECPMRPSGRTNRARVNATRVTVDGIDFASKAECARYQELRTKQRLGQIRNLRPHPRFGLDVAGIHIGHYTGDSEYEELRDGVWHLVVEDVKSAASRRREDYPLRTRLFRALYPTIEFREHGETGTRRKRAA